MTRVVAWVIPRARKPVTLGGVLPRAVLPLRGCESGVARESDLPRYERELSLHNRFIYPTS